jgi:hypothetical protein
MIEIKSGGPVSGLAPAQTPGAKPRALRVMIEIKSGQCLSCSASVEGQGEADMSDSPLEFGLRLMRERSFLKGFCARQPLTPAKTEQIVCATLRRAWLNRGEMSLALNLRTMLVEIATAEMDRRVRRSRRRATPDFAGAVR